MKLNNLTQGLLALSFVGFMNVASAANVAIGNNPTGGAISPFGIPDSQTYGQVFSAPITGTLTSFTLSLNGGVGSLYGGVDGWNGTSAHGFGFGSSGNLYTSSSVSSSGAQSYTFSPNINVIAGQLYVAYLSVFGDPGAMGGTTMPLGDSSDPNILYMVWNNSSDPKNNPSWNYFFNTGNAQFSATFSSISAVPEPESVGLMLTGLMVLARMTRRTKQA